MERLRIFNARLVTPYRVLENAGVLVEGGKIIEAGQSVVKSGGCMEIDADGRFLSPGFIDIHVHGGGGHDFMDGTAEAFIGAARTHAMHGSTTILPTTLACDDRELVNMLDVFKQVKTRRHDGASMPGLHLEGPYFSMEQKGAQDPRYIINPAHSHYTKVLEAGGSDILRWSIAPELDGALELGQELRRRGILPSIAHTDAFFERIEEAFECGYTHLTHMYSAMSTMRRIDGMRCAGAVESAYILDEMTVEVIADGIHLPSPFLRQVYNNVGAARTALITDAMRAAGIECTESIIGSLSGGIKVAVEGGVAKLMDRSAFAGSVATMDRAVRTMVKLGIPIADAVRMATSTPARIMGLGRTKGVVAPGMDADLLLFDADININFTIVGGRIVYR